jgi:signal peptidase II
MPSASEGALRQRLLYGLIAVGVLVLDIITKMAIIANFRLYESRPVIDNFFQIVHVRNTGAAFGLGADTDSLLIQFLLYGGAVVVFFLVLAYALRSPVSERLLQVGLHLIMGGAIGNLLDRYRYGSVVDFLDFYVVYGGREYHWPAFNVADTAICIGIGLLFLDMWRKPAEEPAPAAS